MAAYDIEGRVALITGASRGIGAALARELALKNVHLALMARTEEELINVAKDCRAFGVGVMANLCDVREPEQVEWAVKNTIQTYGRVDILITNAAVIGDLVRIPDTDPDTWTEVVDINVNGSYYFAREVGKEMRKMGGGRIMFVSSSVGRVPRAKWAAYSVSKRAVEGLMELMATEADRTGILVCSLNPGGTATDMRRIAFPDEDQSRLPQPEHVARAMVQILQAADDEFNGRAFDARDFL